jgi:hypothetical protein
MNKDKDIIYLLGTIFSGIAILIALFLIINGINKPLWVIIFIALSTFTANLGNYYFNTGAYHTINEINNKVKQNSTTTNSYFTPLKV